MELKVHIDQTVRIVCGLSEQTTVQEVILALAQALKQTGRFYLIECCSGGSGGTGSSSRRNRARIMAPHEKPLHTLKSYFSLSDSSDDNVEFHLVRTSLTQSNKPTNSITSLLLNINRQQYLLNEQSARFNDLVDSIRFEESKHENKLDAEYVKRRLFHLELKSKLNERKLKKIAHSEDYSEMELRREVELNEFLRAQVDYNRRKLDAMGKKLENVEQEREKLEIDHRVLSSNAMNEKKMEEMFNQVVRQFEINRAKLNYLEVNVTNLEENICQKRQLYAHLQNELEYICSLPPARCDALEAVWMSDSSSEAESSSESISNMLSDAGGRHRSPETPDNAATRVTNLEDIYYF